MIQFKVNYNYDIGFFSMIEYGKGDLITSHDLSTIIDLFNYCIGFLSCWWFYQLVLPELSMSTHHVLNQKIYYILIDDSIQ